MFFNGYSDLFAKLLIGNMVLVRNVQKHLIASQRPMFSSLTRWCQSPQFTGYKNMEMTREHISFTSDPKDMLFSLSKLSSAL